MKNHCMTTRCSLLLGVALALVGCAKLNPKFEDSLNNALRAQGDGFQQCYEKTLKKNPEAQGEMTLKLSFAPNEKKVDKAKVTDSQIPDNGMKKCVSKVAKGIETTETPGTWVDGKYTLDFVINE